MKELGKIIASSVMILTMLLGVISVSGCSQNTQKAA